MSAEDRADGAPGPGRHPTPSPESTFDALRRKPSSASAAMGDNAGMDIDPPIMGYYGRGGEQDRLFTDPVGVLERLRTWDLLERVLPTRGTVLDVGGAAGVHAAWLVEHGYDVELFDPVPLHVTQARELADSLPTGQRFSAEVADARDVPREATTPMLCCCSVPCITFSRPLTGARPWARHYDFCDPAACWWRLRSRGSPGRSTPIDSRSPPTRQSRTR